MKLLKIGSSPVCDIVLHSPYVSALHAEITVLDDGGIIIEDKGSSNGTFVKKQRLDANVETPIRRGDYVRIADQDLPWARIPSAPNYTRFKTVYNIGSSMRNELNINNGTVSRYHATLKITKGGKAFISDNGSKNGTSVNGVHITADKDVQIKRGDVVMVAGEDITERIRPLLPQPIWKWIAIGTAAVAAVVAAAFIIPQIIGGFGDPKNSSSTVYIYSEFHYNVTVDGITFRYPMEEDESFAVCGTGFFLDDEGRIGTCRHVAVPWDKAYSKEKFEEAEMNVRTLMHNQLRVSNVSSEYDYEMLRSTMFGQLVADACSSLPELNAKLSAMLSSPIELTGEIDFMGIGYNGKVYKTKESFSRCSLVAESGTVDKDVAIIQLDDKTTPSNVKYTFDMKKVKDTPLEPMKDRLYTIGYPHGLLWSMDAKTQTLSASINETKCSKSPTKFDFEFQANGHPGQSGSPVFLENGRLVGIISAAHVGEAGPTVAAHASFLKELYDSCTKPIATSAK